jgi:hypothetical protein
MKAFLLIVFALIVNKAVPESVFQFKKNNAAFKNYFREQEMTKS